MAMTLLQKAKLEKSKVKPLGKLDEQTIELLKAWAKGEVATFQCVRTLSIKIDRFYALVVRAFKQIVQSE